MVPPSDEFSITCSYHFICCGWLGQNAGDIRDRKFVPLRSPIIPNFIEIGQTSLEIGVGRKQNCHTHTYRHTASWLLESHSAVREVRLKICWMFRFAAVLLHLGSKFWTRWVIRSLWTLWFSCTKKYKCRHSQTEQLNSYTDGYSKSPWIKPLKTIFYQRYART